MTATISRDFDEVLTAAAAVLGRRAGSALVLGDAEDLGGAGRSAVIRVRLPENPLSESRTVVVKAFPAEGDPQAFLREVASYKYVTALPVAARPGPQLLAADAGARILVLSDLGFGRSLSQLLAGSDIGETTRAVSAWGQALGRMHASTYGGEDDFAALLRQGSRRPGNDLLASLARQAVDGLPAAAGTLGMDPPPRLATQLRAALGLFTEGDFRAFSPADVGPDNILLNDDGVQFMDYEWGGFRDATLDLGYALVTFPARLSPVLASHRRDLEVSLVDAWRSEVRSLWRGVGTDREARRRVLRARTLWVWLSSYWLLAGSPDGAAEHDWALQTGDVRVVLERWGQLGEAAADCGDPDGAATAKVMATAMRRFWFE